jgi:hypothetical protein
MNCSLFGTLPGSLFPESLGKGVVVYLQLGNLELKLLIIVQSLFNLQLGDLELNY